MQKITFVDKNDNVIGSGTKEEALSKGITHRIARVFVFNLKGELLIQKRSDTLPSSPGKWDQSAAGHVDEGESYLEAALRETEEEVGIKNMPFTEITKFYTKETDEKMDKKRFNMLYSAEYDGEVNFDKEEVSRVRWIDTSTLEKWMKEKPSDFTQGFIKSYALYKKHKGNVG